MVKILEFRVLVMTKPKIFFKNVVDNLPEFEDSFEMVWPTPAFGEEPAEKQRSVNSVQTRDVGCHTTTSLKHH